jgi:mRNA interferase RelE/StbE
LFEVNAKNSVLKAISRLDSKGKARIREIIITLKENPVPFKVYDVAKLRGYDNMYRIRVGDLRMVYEVLWTGRIVVIQRIEPRESVYEGL